MFKQCHSERRRGTCFDREIPIDTEYQLGTKRDHILRNNDFDAVFFDGSNHCVIPIFRFSLMKFHADTLLIDSSLRSDNRGGANDERLLRNLWRMERDMNYKEKNNNLIYAISNSPASAYVVLECGFDIKSRRLSGYESIFGIANGFISMQTWNESIPDFSSEKSG